MTYSSLSMSRASAAGSTSQRFVGRNQNAVDYRRGHAKLGPVSNTVILIVLACLLGLLYLTQVTKTDAYGYSIDKLQTEQAVLQEEQENLELAAAQMQSLDRVRQSPEATAMVQAAPSGTVQQ